MMEFFWKKMTVNNTVLKMSVFGVALVRIFPHSDWIRRDREYISVSIQMQENTDQNNSEYGHALRSVSERFLNQSLEWL